MADFKNIPDIQHGPSRASIKVPPLAYALDDELAIQGVKLTLDDFADGQDDGIGPMPPPPAVKWIALIAATLIIVAVWMVLT